MLLAALAVALVWLAACDRGPAPPDVVGQEADPGDVEERHDQARESLDRTERTPIVDPRSTGPSVDAEDTTYVSVHVMDEARHPVAGVRMQLMSELRIRRLAVFPPTDEKGESTLRVCHAELKREGIDSERAKAYVELLFTGAENPGREVDLANPPGKPLVFVLREFGRIDFLLPGSIRGFQPKPVLVLSSLDEEGKPSWSGNEAGGSLTASQSGDLMSAVPVVLGRKWSVLGVAAGEVPLQEKPFSGPRVSGELVQVTMKIATKRSWLSGTLLGEDGRRLSGFSLRARFTFQEKGAGETWRMASSRTNGKGEFLLGLPRLSKEPGTRLRVLFAAALPPSQSKDRRAFGSLEIPLSQEQEEPGFHTLGEVTLPLLKAILSGTILDDRGQAVRARLSIHRVSRQADGKIAYDPIQSQQCRLDPDGSFRVYGDFAERRLSLSIDTRGRAFVPHAPVLVSPGWKDIRIVLQRYGSLRLRLRLPSRSMPQSFFRLELRQESAPIKRLPGPTPGQEGDLLFSNLVPGLYTLKVYGASDPVPCVTIPGIRVKPGARTEDPRLYPMDLASVWRQITIRVTLPDGKPATSGYVMMQAGKTGIAPTAWAIEGGVASFPTTQASVDLVVRVPGTLEGRLQNVVSTAELKLRPGLERTLENPGSIPPGHELVFAFRAVAGEGVHDDRIRVRHGSGGVISMGPRVLVPGTDRELVLGPKQASSTFRFTTPGRYRVYCQLRRRADSATAMVQGAVQEIRIQNQEGKVSLSLGLTRARLQAAMQALSRER